MDPGNGALVWVFEEHEVVTLFLCIGVLLFILANRAVVKRLPYPRLLVAGPVLLAISDAGAILAGASGGWIPFAHLERAAFAASAIVAALWVGNLRFRSRESER